MPNQTTRRAFLKLTTAAASVTAIEFSHALPTGNAIALIVDPGSAVTASEPVEWAVEQFRRALTVKGITSSTSGSALAGATTLAEISSSVWIFIAAAKSCRTLLVRHA